MKRNIAIITTVVSALLALVFVVLLICAAFGAVTAEDFGNNLVKALLLVFSAIYLIDTGVAVYCQTHKSAIAKEVTVASTSGGNVKIAPNTVRNLIKKYVSGIEGVKFRNYALTIDETGVRLDLSVGFYGGKKTYDASSYIRTLVTDICRTELDLRLSAVNIRVTDFKSVYAPDPDTFSRPTEKLGTENKFTAPQLVTAENEDETECPVIEDEEEFCLKSILDKLSGDETKINDVSAKAQNSPDENVAVVK